MATSAETKKALSNSLKNICLKKSYLDISVSEITDNCHMNRQSFYYHFNDKNELLLWTYQNNDFGRLLSSINQNCEDQIIYLLKAMENEKEFYVNTVKNNSSVFEKYLFKKINTLFFKRLMNFNTKKSISSKQLLFLAQYYTLGLCGVIIKWIENGMNEKSETVDSLIEALNYKEIFQIYFKK